MYLSPWILIIFLKTNINTFPFFKTSQGTSQLKNLSTCIKIVKQYIQHVIQFVDPPPQKKGGNLGFVLSLYVLKNLNEFHFEKKISFN